MQGNIDFSGTLSGSIAGGGGSAVTITPTLQSGTKIADYTIDSESGSLYAPTPQQSGVIDVQVSNTQVPDYETIVENNVAKLNLYPYLEKSEAYTIIDLVNDEIERVDGKVGALEQIVPYKQDKLTAGNNITIDANNVISASGSWDYSTNEVNTGQRWIDGNYIFIRTFSITPTTLSTGGIIIPDIDLSGAAQLLGGFASYSVDSNAKYIPLSVWRYNNVIQYAGMAAYVDTITVKYTKSS